MKKKFYVTRDEDGDLLLWISVKPRKCIADWCWENPGITNGDAVELPKTMFPDVKWEDKEPLEVKLISSKSFNMFLTSYARATIQKDEYNIRHHEKK